MQPMTPEWPVIEEASVWDDDALQSAFKGRHTVSQGMPSIHGVLTGLSGAMSTYVDSAHNGVQSAALHAWLLACA